MPLPQTSSASCYQFLALGDSYTIGESVAPKESWPYQLTHYVNQLHQLNLCDPVIVARTGWRTDELKKALSSKHLPNNFDLVSLLIGVNDQYQGKMLSEYKENFESILRDAIRHAQNNPSRVMVISIPDYGYTPFGLSGQKKISQELDDYNEWNLKISKKYNTHYYTITDISRYGLADPSLISTDNLHPSVKQYKKWVERIVDKSFLDIFR